MGRGASSDGLTEHGRVIERKTLRRADARNPTRNATASERAAMLARGIRTDSGSVASAMLTALLRSRLGFCGRVGFLDPFQLRGNYPRMELNPSRERKRAVSPGPATKAA